jgi:hypothetical protein
MWSFDVVIAATIALATFISSIFVAALITSRRLDRLSRPGALVDWVPAAFVAVSAGIIFVSLITYTAYGIFVYLACFVPFIFVTCFVLLVVGPFRKRWRQSLSMLLTLVVFTGLSGAFVWGQNVLRPSIRWLLWSHNFKAEVLAQPAPVDGELRHMEWEATGFAGMDNFVYLVFDPTETLASAAKSHAPGKFSGIPCKVPRVLRLEDHWYSVPFYTDEVWGNGRDCE